MPGRNDVVPLCPVAQRHSIGAAAGLSPEVSGALIGNHRNSDVTSRADSGPLPCASRIVCDRDLKAAKGA